MNTASLFGSLSKIDKIPLLSKLSPPSTKAPSATEMAAFERGQKLAYACAVEVAQAMQPGWSERRVASWMESYLHDYGVRSYFHRPLAWFGPRTRFKGFRSGSDAMPSSRTLNASDVVVLDLAPLVDGYVSDIGFSFSLEPNERLTKARSCLLDLRKELVTWFESERTTAEIWQEVDRFVKAAGYENCVPKYQMKVLGHRVNKVPLSRFPSPTMVFSTHSYWALASRGFFPELLSPWHHGHKLGLWAIEPHIGVDREFGLKFEEILVVDENGKARWLDDDVPHVKLPAGLY